MDFKWGLAIFMFIIALYLIYTSFIEIKDIEKGKAISISEVQQKILEKPLCIVVKKSNTKNDENVINCALSYFQSAMLSMPKKRIDYYAFENDKCTALVQDKCSSFPCQGREINESKKECLRSILSSNCYVIFVEEGDSSLSQSYENRLDVFVNESYKEGQCTIKIKS